ncbi:hypothetical protein K2Z84_24160, partial [Candidatus Binatia bacterium]|nr:hypothetical protein [Candidatus Binatia bacterium]
MTAHEPTGRSASGRAGAAIAVVFWTACWLLPWPALLGRDPFLCSTLGLVLFCLPGFCADLLLRRDARLTVARRAPVALVLSAALTGALGFIGSLLHLPTASVGLALWAAGAVGLARVVRRGTPPSSGEPYDGQRIFAGVLLLAIALATARLCLSPVMGADDMTYVARVTWFQQTPYLSFRGMIFGGDVQISPRDWLAFWPLCEAIVANLSGVHGLQLTTLYLGPLLAPLAVLAVYGLARALGMSRRAAVTSCALQVVALLLLVGRDQPGGPFFQRLVEDKFLALFVFGPALLQLVIGVLDGDGARARVALALGWLGIVLVHPTALGIVFLIVCAFCALELVATRRRTPLLVLAIVIPITAAASSVRFLPSETHHAAYFGIEEAARANAISGARKRRVDVVAGTRFYGIGRR